MCDRAEHWPKTGPFIAFERNQSAEQKTIGDKSTRAVDRIQHPAVTWHRAYRFLDAEFFTQHTVRRITRFDQCAHRLFGAPVGLCYGRSVGLRDYRRCVEEMVPDHAERCADQL